MNLLLIRHARAEDRRTFSLTGKSDDLRPLTADGIRRMTRAARGLRKLVPTIHMLVSSPLKRAVETAQIISDAYGDLPLVERDELAPGADPEKLIDWLGAQGRNQDGAGSDEQPICLVGHEPDLSDLLGILLADRSQQPEKIKKGSATMVSFQALPVASGGTLQWHHTAKELGSSRTRPTRRL